MGGPEDHVTWGGGWHPHQVTGSAASDQGPRVDELPVV